MAAAMLRNRALGSLLISSHKTLLASTSSLPPMPPPRPLGAASRRHAALWAPQIAAVRGVQGGCGTRAMSGGKDEEMSEADLEEIQKQLSTLKQEKLSVKDLQGELESGRVSFADCFDINDLLQRCAEMRAAGTLSKSGHMLFQGEQGKRLQERANKRARGEPVEAEPYFG
eukprot:CAMPEP_0173409726 /NCGR_PEP_ID=MMETSP1356-20130122/72887_1 /TAXON_ID=77927 ORGANISM="Hemiselmis virescens, Strain PCC157" /NCGR_SAMPLE_ID=MMETSP1356 /ASSEMBLY_ACC=CAM_ASM_000847 /LENGTH=170 /DNA_ID=CAMNT_0014371253 /DNA_START=43 /DNA_END=552 /DNA_ORIENTATION=+